MAGDNDKLAQSNDLPETRAKVRAHTPARLLAGRSGVAYRTNTQLELREAHAAARDAVRTPLNLVTALGDDFVRNWNLFEVSSQAATKDEYLLRPDLGRHLSKLSREEVSRRCPPGKDLQIALGDGLSVTAVASQVPRILPPLSERAKLRKWTVGRNL